MVTLDIISDAVCPWCYIGKARLDRALAEAGNPFDIRWRMFRLNPDMPPEGMDRREYLDRKFGGSERAAGIYAAVAAAGEEAGLDLRLDRIARAPQTIDAHRVIHWAQTTGHQVAVVDELFRRYFEEGEDISDRAVLADAAGRAGMERPVVERLLATDADLDALEEEEETARRMGVTGVPCFIVGQRYVIQGAQDTATWMRVIREIGDALRAGGDAGFGAGDRNEDGEMRQ